MTDSYDKAQEILKETMEKILQSGLSPYETFELNSMIAKLKIDFVPTLYRLSQSRTKKEEETQMTTLKEFAKTYEAKKTKNIAELSSVPIDLELHEESGKDKDGKSYSYQYIELNELKYRVPASVIEQIQSIIKSRPTCTKVKVEAKGTGMNTKYNTVPID